MIFWFVYALLFFFAAWFLVVSAIEYRRSSRLRETVPPPPRPRLNPLDVEKQLVALEAQSVVAPRIALDEARAFYATIYERLPFEDQSFADLLQALEARATERRVRS